MQLAAAGEDGAWQRLPQNTLSQPPRPGAGRLLQAVECAAVVEPPDVIRAGRQQGCRAKGPFAEQTATAGGEEAQAHAAVVLDEQGERLSG